MRKRPIEWWIGRFLGILLGISMRADVPEDIRNVCKNVRIEYDNEEVE